MVSKHTVNVNVKGFIIILLYDKINMVNNMASKKKKKSNNNQIPNVNKPQNYSSATPNIHATIKHNEEYLSNNINRIKNIVMNNKTSLRELQATNSRYIESEKTGMAGFIRASEMLNIKVLKELDTMMALKDNYRALEEKLKFDVDLKSELLDYNTLNLSLLATNSQFIKQYERDHPCIPGGAYTKEEAEKYYGKYFKDPNISDFFDIFYNENNDTYTVPDIVFNKHDVTEGKYIKTTVTKYEIYVDLSGYSAQQQQEIRQHFIDTIVALDPHSGYNTDFANLIGNPPIENGVLKADLTPLLNELVSLRKKANAFKWTGEVSQEQIDMLDEAIAGLEDLFAK